MHKLFSRRAASIPACSITPGGNLGKCRRHLAISKTLFGSSRNTSHEKNILILGSGAVGTYYGARLAEAGHNVYFFTNSQSSNYRTAGITVSSPNGDIRIPKPNVVSSKDEVSRKMDWIVVAVKSYAIAEDIQNLVAPSMQQNTRILIAMNGLGMEKKFAAWFSPQKIFGAIPYIAAYRRPDDGHIEHVKYNGLDIGHYLDTPAELLEAKHVWGSTTLDLTISPCLLLSRWGKVLFNFPFNGLSVAHGGITIQDIVQDPALRCQAHEIIEECRLAANADLTFNNSKHRIAKDYHEKVFGMLDKIGPYKTSSTIDFLNGKQLELHYIFQTPIDAALEHGTPHSRMSALFDDVKRVCAAHAT
mmetsp:Transcript_41802/g.65396  ORF Transcript_41802/g.65396 Transcript_41802/m.65396 type:complete len:360 (+) Transcript_41802:97-1176(+)